MEIVAIDIGGTFTDLASLDPLTGELRFSKSLTTPPDFERGALDCLRLAEIAPASIDILRHGTTVVINALLEQKGARTALVTSEGFRDILEIGRGNRPEGFNLFYRRMAPVVPRELRFDIPERMNARGEVLTPLDMAALARVAEEINAADVEAVAVCFLHSWRNPAHEIAAGDYLRKHTRCFVSCSHELSREFREYERTTTVALNAYVGPPVEQYLARFGGALRGNGFEGRMYLMGSNGGVLTEDDSLHRPLLLVESGPVGGVAGAAEIGAVTGLSNLVAFDMGGTTAKAVLIENGEAAVSPLYWVGGYEHGYPVQAAVLGIIEVGAGGGSIAGTNEFGALQVGPRSASAKPGPACYGLGGTEPTVTDANLLLGRLDGENFLGGTMKLERDLAAGAIGTLAKKLGQEPVALASGVLRIATLNMATAVRKVTIERGYDPRDFTMVAFGGAGPLHAVDVAREIGMKRVIIPPQPGHFSAYGMLFADFRLDLTDTIAAQLATLDLADVERRFVAMEAEGGKRIDSLGLKVKSLRTMRYAEMRYRRQEYTVKVRLPEGRPVADTAELGQLFEDAYKQRFGHFSRDMEVEVLMLRVVVDGRTARPSLASRRNTTVDPKSPPRRRDIWLESGGYTPCNVWQRRDLAIGRSIAGPCVIEEEASTTVLTPGDSAVIDATGNIVITIGARA